MLGWGEKRQSRGPSVGPSGTGPHSLASPPTGGEHLAAKSPFIPKGQQVCRHASAGGIENDQSPASEKRLANEESFKQGIETTPLALSQPATEMGALVAHPRLRDVQITEVPDGIN